MEQELAEAIKQRQEERQQWADRASGADAELAALRTSLETFERQSAEVARQESELASLREAELVSQEALEKEKMEVARLERELALMIEAEHAAVQASHNASERDLAKIVWSENKIVSIREVVDHVSEDASEREKSELEKPEREREDAQRKGEILAEIWRHLRPLACEDEHTAEELPFPDDLSLFLNTVQSIETQLSRLKDERSESEERCAELTHTHQRCAELMETLQGKRMYLIASVYGIQLLISTL